MNEKNNSEEKNKDLEKTDVIEEDIKEEDNVTREINLDDLYDGAVNNTVVLDPITNSEVFLPPKKPNYTILGVILAVIVLLILYYVNNKSDLTRTNQEVKPKTTTTSTSKIESGTLTCNYSSKSDAEEQTVTFMANYFNSSITDSKFTYSIVVTSDSKSAVVTDLENQYETFYTNNSLVKGSTTTFDKTAKGFTFENKINYAKIDFESILIEDGKTVLYIKPSSNDTLKSVQSEYTSNGFTCNVNSEE